MQGYQLLKNKSTSDAFEKQGHILVATKYKNTVTNYFAKKRN